MKPRMISLDLSPSAYLSQAKACRIPQPEEAALLRSWLHEHDTAARDTLLAGTQWMVAQNAGKVARNSRAPDHFSDLVVEGQIRLIDMVPEYDFSAGTYFSQFASTPVYRAMLAYARHSIGSMVHHFNGQFMQRDADMGVDGFEEFSKYLPDAAAGPEAICEHQQLVERATGAFRKLTRTEYEVVRGVVMEEASERDQGKELGLSRYMVKQTLGTALVKLSRAVDARNVSDIVIHRRNSRTRNKLD